MLFMQDVSPILCWLRRSWRVIIARDHITVMGIAPLIWVKMTTSGHTGTWLSVRRSLLIVSGIRFLNLATQRDIQIDICICVQYILPRITIARSIVAGVY